MSQFGTTPFRDLTDDEVKAVVKGKGVKHVTICDPGVAGGLKKTDYMKRKVPAGFGGKATEPIASGDPKFDMYANALPKPIRQKVVDAGLDVRALYKEYRAIGRDGMIAKYS